MRRLTQFESKSKRMGGKWDVTANNCWTNRVSGRCEQTDHAAVNRSTALEPVANDSTSAPESSINLRRLARCWLRAQAAMALFTSLWSSWRSSASVLQPS